MKNKWMLKNFFERGLNALPPRHSERIYYQIQRKFGSLKEVDPIGRLKTGKNFWIKLLHRGKDPTDKVFLEVGTGSMPIVPLALWLLGAKEVISVDLYRLAKIELIRDYVWHICENSDSIKQAFFPLSIINSRLETLTSLLGSETNFSFENYAKATKLKYIAPGDASNIDLEANSIDFHISHAVLEHIPSREIPKILLEAKRLTAKDGLIVHAIDYSDHYAKSDSSISYVNFLRYSEAKWSKINNRFNYMNRLRHDDFLKIFDNLNLNIVETEEKKHPNAKKYLSEHIEELSEIYRDKELSTLEITGAWIIATP